MHMVPNEYGRRSGFILVTSLLVLVVLAGLSAGAFFLTNMNLRIAENTRSATIAQYNANEGLDVALLALAREFYEREDGSWPSLAELQARVPAGSPYRVVALELDPVNSLGVSPGGVVTVEGTGPRSSLYETGARFVGELTPIEIDPTANPLFGTGWVTDSEIQLNGNTSFTIPLWAGEVLEGSSTKVLASSGNFAHSGFVGGQPATCTIHRHSGVNCTRGQQPPVVPVFDFDETQARWRADERPTCSVTYTSNATYAASVGLPNQTVCLGPGVTLIVTGTATGLYVMGPRDSTVDLRSNTVPSGGQPDGVGIKVSAGQILLGNGDKDLQGANTLFSASDVEIRRLGASALGASTVSTLIATEGDISVENVRGTLYAALWTNGSVCKQGAGGLSFAGSILARGEDPRPGTLCNNRNTGIYWNGGGGGSFTGVSNPDIPDASDDGNNPFAAAGIRIQARRP